MRDSLPTRAGLLLGVLLIAFGIVWTALAQAQEARGDAPPARLQVYVFEGGRPVDDLIVRFGEATGRTADGGHWRAELAPGRDRLTLFDNAQALTALPLALRPGELVQVIITLFGAERRAMVSIESSLGVSAVEYGETPAQAEPGATGSGILRGRVVSTEDGKPIEEARIFVSGTPIELRTDPDGRFEAEVPAGSYSVSVLHAEFATRTVDGVEISVDGETERNFELPPAGLELAEFVVIEPFIEGSLSSVLAEQRETASVANILGAEQISRSGDSDVGSALSRVTGLTLVDGQFIFIRGLGERYSSTLLNGANVPSPDPTRKVVPLDLFPTGVIRSILVQKGYSPDMPGDFGGGVVEIRTRGIPEQDFLSVGLSTGLRDGTTFSDGLTYRGGDTDFAGFDDGTRQLPGLVRELTADGQQLPGLANIVNPDGLTVEELEALGESFVNIYDPIRKNIKPDRGASIEGGKRFDIGSKLSAGLTGSVLWDDSWVTRSEIRNSFIPLGDGTLRPNDAVTVDRTLRTIGLTGFVTGGVNYNDLHEIDLTTMILRQTEDETSRLEGFNLDEDGDIRIDELEFEERQLIANQAEGRHVFPFLNRLRLEWDYSEARARLETPDERRIRFDPDSVAELIFSRRGDSNERAFTLLNDRSQDWGASAFVPFGLGWLDAEISGGYRMLEKSRDSSIRRFQFDGISNLSQEVRRRQSAEEILIPDNIGRRGLSLEETTRETDTYMAALDVDAWYTNLDVTVAETIRLAGGVRVEDWTQTVETFALFDPNFVPRISALGDTDLFPAASLTWFISDRQQLRASYAETIIRPDFRELSPAPFTDPVLEREVIGNENLVTSDVLHLDMRWEFYPEPEELISLGVFYKLIDRPIEQTIEAGVEQRLTFGNAEEAENFGIEFEGRKTLGFLGRWIGMEPLLSRFWLAGNASLIESEITIGPEQRGILTSTSRELQGQSPLIINFQIGYDDPNRNLDATLLYNFVGERITEVGVLGAPDKKEQGAAELDFVVRWRWADRLGIKAKFGNLLDSDFEIRQGPEITQQYSTGRTMSLSLTYDFR